MKPATTIKTIIAHFKGSVVFKKRKVNKKVIVPITKMPRKKAVPQKNGVFFKKGKRTEAKTTPNKKEANKSNQLIIFLPRFVFALNYNDIYYYGNNS